MDKNESLWRRRVDAVARGVAQAHPIAVERARNAEVWDADGRRYLDFAAGIAALSTGHLHPRVVAAVEAQLQRFSHAAFQVMPYEPAVALAERLNDLAPGPGPKKTLFLTTGSEAIENAVKIARAATGRPGVLAFGGGFHGRTLMCLALTGKVAPYKSGFGPFPPDVYHAPFPMAYHGVSVEDALQGLERLFRADIAPEQVAALVVEPVLGEGGFYIAPPDFLQALRALCDRHGIVLIVDEVQTGFARTGKLFAIEHAGVAPDLIVLAKGMSGGFPLSAVVGKAALMDVPAPGSLGGTYGASPLGCAAAQAVLDVLQDEDLCGRARAIGERMRARLETLQRQPMPIGEVRALGAMVALELVQSRQSRAPAPEAARALTEAARRQGLLLLTCGVFGNVVRLLPPLTTPDEQIEEGMDCLERALSCLEAPP